jgi:hypothetical protein
VHIKAPLWPDQFHPISSCTTWAVTSGCSAWTGKNGGAEPRSQSGRRGFREITADLGTIPSARGSVIYGRVAH